jgi:glycogen synthase
VIVGICLWISPGGRCSDCPCFDCAVTGGLRDTVIDFNPEEQSGTGWTFGNCDASGLMHATGLALSTLRDYPKDFEVGAAHTPYLSARWQLAFDVCGLPFSSFGCGKSWQALMAVLRVKSSERQEQVAESFNCGGKLNACVLCVVVCCPLQGIQLRGMQRDSTWNGAAEQYEQLFEWALLDQPYA